MVAFNLWLGYVVFHQPSLKKFIFLDDPLASSP